MRQKYFVLQCPFNERNCVVREAPSSIKKSYRLAFGVPIAADYPKSPRFKMDTDHAGLAVSDAIHNSLGALMVSQRVKDILGSEVKDEVEYLPFTLVNHKGKDVPGAFYIVNVIGTVDCVDRTQTVGRASAMKPSEYRSIKKLFLDEERIPERSKLFRLSAMPETMIVREDLRRAIERDSVKGLDYLDLGAKIDL